MPWSPAQHRLFEAAAHNPSIAQQHGIPVNTAATMASEGIARPQQAARAKKPSVPGMPKAPTRPQVLARVLQSMKGP